MFRCKSSKMFNSYLGVCYVTLIYCNIVLSHYDLLSSLTKQYRRNSLTILVILVLNWSDPITTALNTFLFPFLLLRSCRGLWGGEGGGSKGLLSESLELSAAALFILQTHKGTWLQTYFAGIISQQRVALANGTRHWLALWWILVPSASPGVSGLCPFSLIYPRCTRARTHT